MYRDSSSAITSLAPAASSGAVSSFGYSGTIAHSTLEVLRRSHEHRWIDYPSPPAFRRRRFGYRVLTLRRLSAVQVSAPQADAAVLAAAATRSLRVAEVLELVHRTAGATADADTPLLEAGVD